MRTHNFGKVCSAYLGNLMKTILWVVGFFALIALSPATTRGDTVSFNFTNCPSGDTCPGAIASSQTYTSGGLSFVASAFSGPNTPAQLFVKQNGGDESGLGLVGASDWEIQPGNFIQLNMSELVGMGLMNGLFSAGSVESGESFKVCDSSTAGSMAGASCSTSSLNEQLVPISWSSSDPFVDITAGSGDVLLATLEITAGDAPSAAGVPEPGTGLLLFFGGFVLLVVVGRWRRFVSSPANSQS